MMCANRAFLRTPEVELHGEHRFSPTPDLKLETKFSIV